MQATVDMYFRYKFADGVESQLGLLVPAGGTEVLTQNLNDLAFDGVQTTTWYTRFFDDTGYDEMGSLPLVFPHNHYVKSTQNPRELLLFVKCFDMAASYLTRACQYAVTRGLLGMPFQAWEQYQQWRQGLDPAQTRARGWGGRLTWDTPVAAIIRDFAQFLSEVIAPTDNDPAVLASLVSYEEAAALVNLRLREANWDQLCAAVPPGDDSNPVTPEHQQLDFATSYALDALEAHLDGNPLPPPPRTPTRTRRRGTASCAWSRSPTAARCVAGSPCSGRSSSRPPKRRPPHRGPAHDRGGLHHEPECP